MTIKSGGLDITTRTCSTVSLMKQPFYGPPPLARARSLRNPVKPGQRRPVHQVRDALVHCASHCETPSEYGYSSVWNGNRLTGRTCKTRRCRPDSCTLGRPERLCR